MSNCDHCLVRNRAICSALSADELLELNKLGRQRTITRGSALMWEGDDSLMVANVIDGMLKLSTSAGDGTEQIVGIVYPSDFIGRPFGARSHHSVTALTDARVCTFTRSDFDNFAQSHPRLEHKLLERTLTELDRARHWMALLGRKSATQKVCSFLLEMSERLAPAGCSFEGNALHRFELPFGRQQVADILGLTIETVSRQLTRLKADGLIDLPSRREIEIVDRAGLADLAE